MKLAVRRVLFAIGAVALLAFIAACHYHGHVYAAAMHFHGHP